MHADAMNTQVHEATGASPYELVFGQEPRSVLFPTTTASGVILEEDLIDEGVQFGIVEQLTKGSEDDITVKGTAEDAEGMLVEMQKPGGSTAEAEEESEDSEHGTTENGMVEDEQGMETRKPSGSIAGAEEESEDCEHGKTENGTLEDEQEMETQKTGGSTAGADEESEDSECGTTENGLVEDEQGMETEKPGGAQLGLKRGATFLM